jgi:hypothetical protein
MFTCETVYSDLHLSVGEGRHDFLVEEGDGIVHPTPMLTECGSERLVVLRRCVNEWTWNMCCQRDFVKRFFNSALFHSKAQNLSSESLH